jgi:cyclophilin family peptidyl-prolyl cis-trans isomerase
VISVLGGVVLILGTFLLFFNPNSGGAGGAVRQRTSDAVRGDTTPAADSPAAPTPAVSPTAITQRSFSAAPPFTINPAANYTATVKTDKGDITIQLDPKAAPQAANNFIFLAKDGFYDGLAFQRVVPNFVAQAGATNVDGSGGPGYSIPDESSPLQHDPGAIAFALTAGAGNTAGSQFYVALAPLPQQDGKDTVFGKVTAGLEILQQQPARDPKDPNAAPALKINSITITQQ